MDAYGGKFAFDYSRTIFGHTQRYTFLSRHRIMCLYPKFIKNPKYKPNKKNGGNVPQINDIRTQLVPIGCGNCIECRKQKAREWQIRLCEEMKTNTKAYYVTLTFSEDALTKLCLTYKSSECNAVAGKAIRLFLERWRRTYKKSLKHWLITELGHNGTERIHLHGIIFTNENISEDILQKYWQYGIVDIGEYCNQRTINYIIKYVTKIDNDHKQYKPQIFCSAGLGKSFLNTHNIRDIYKYNKGETNEAYTLPNGQKCNLPIYYRNHLFTDEEREQMWCDRLDKNERYVRGICIRHLDTEKGQNELMQVLKQQQEENERLGFGNDSKEWQQKAYNVTLRRLNAKLKWQKPRKT